MSPRARVAIAAWRTRTTASGNSDLVTSSRSATSTGLLQHSVYIGAGPLARLLRRRQRPRPALLDGARAQWRDAIVRNAHGALCILHPTRVESGHRSLPQFHELRPPMAGTVGLGGQSRADALGVGRPRGRRCGPGSPPMGRCRCSRPRFPRSRTSPLHVPGRSHSWGWTPIARNSMATPSPNSLRGRTGRPIDVPALLDGNE